MSPGEALLARAAAAGASDLAFDPQDNGTLWALARIDGVRQRIGTIPAAEAASTIARLKAFASLPAYITDEAQDGRIDGRPYGVPGDVRVAVLPTVRGGRLALRLPAARPARSVDTTGGPLPARRPGLPLASP